MKTDTGVRTPLLKDIAYEKIKAHILNDLFKSGSFLSERELIEILQMSKTPIKNALVRLETEGFVTVSSKQGIIINDLSAERIFDIYNLRIALETFTCDQIKGKLTQQHIDRIEKNLSETESYVASLDVKNFTKLDHEYHLILCGISENKEIYKILLNYQDHLHRITLKHLRKDPEKMKQFYEEHLSITEHLKAGTEESITLMKNHLQKSKESLFL